VETAVSIAQIILGVVLIVMIMLEVRGSSMGGFLGGGDSPVYRTRRGFERTLFNMTIIVTILFFAVSFLNVVVSRAPAG
jgi:preprotein translocase subunit SecG